MKLIDKLFRKPGWWPQKKKVNRRVEPKRVKVERRQGITIELRQVTGAMMVVVLVTGAALFWTQLMDPRTFPMKQVQVEGVFERVGAQELRAVVAEKGIGGFFNVDVEGVTQALMEMPWVAHAEVRRIWPDTWHVSVREQVAIGYMNNDGLVNMYGEIFYPVKESYPEGLVRLKGPEVTAAAMAERFRLFAELVRGTEIDIDELELTERRAWRLKLKDGTAVVLGRSEMNERMRRFVSFYPRLKTAGDGVRYVDMRYTNGFAVRWQLAPQA